MKKKLDVNAFASSLRGESVFFPTKENAPAPDQAGDPQEPIKEEQPFPPSPLAEVQESNHDTVIPRHHDTMQPRNHDTASQEREDNIEEKVRKAVKQVGKEAATHRFTLAEKNALADIEYSYKRQGIRTSENEITRIAMNYFVEEYRQNGENSLLAKVLKRLNS